MKACRVCGRLYPDDAGFCPADGQELSDSALVPVPANDPDARVGRVLFDRYQIRRVVADGGMGRVYEALDQEEKRNVAVKILHTDVTIDEVAVERFKREFEVSQHLSHRYVVDVVGFHAAPDGTHALVMEFLYGEELRATLKRENRLSPARALRMLSQVALGLGDAHRRKLVHRDLKPDNIFLCQTNDGDISKILDFGSVKDKAANAKKLTALGTTIGSPYYMSPEQAQGLETLDARADVWALGAIFYECITGAVPFNGPNGPSILFEILTREPVPPSRQRGVVDAIPPALDAVVGHALTKEVSERIPSVDAFADAVGRSYGLSGSHEEWAVTPQAELERRIGEALSVATHAHAPMSTSTQQFFGEADGFGLEDAIDEAFRDAHAGTEGASNPDDFGDSGAPRWPVHSSAPPSRDDERTSGTPSDYALPTNSSSWVLPTVVLSLVALVVVIVVYVVS